MRYRTYPGTDLTVSEVGFGMWTMASGWWGEYTDAQVIRLIHRACDLGVTLFDSADTYGNGRADRLLGLALAGRRGEAVLSTKIGYDHAADHGNQRGQKEAPHNCSPGYLRGALERSLRRFKVDVIDLVSFHNAKAQHVADDAIWETFERFVDEGKVRYWGATLGPSNGYLYEGLDLILERRATNLQVINNILEPFPGQVLTEAAAVTEATGIMVRVPHSSGLLEGRYTEDTEFVGTDHRRHRPRSWLLNGLKKVDTLRFTYSERDITLGQVALKWLLDSAAVMTTLPNISTMDQLEEFAAASDLPDLPESDMTRIRELQRTNFGVSENHMRYKGVMWRQGEPPVAPAYRYPGDQFETRSHEEHACSPG